MATEASGVLTVAENQRLILLALSNIEGRLERLLQAQCAVFALNGMAEVGETLTGVRSPVKISPVLGPAGASVQAGKVLAP